MQTLEEYRDDLRLLHKGHRQSLAEQVWKLAVKANEGIYASRYKLAVERSGCPYELPSRRKFIDQPLVSHAVLAPLSGTVAIHP